MLMNQTLNKKNPDGSINLLLVNGSDHGLIVSPYHPDFYTQIEDDILPLVKSMCDLGFYVVDSCGGHFEELDYDNAHVCAAFASKKSLHNFLTSIRRIPFVSIIVKDTWLKESNETQFINELFLTNHKSFVFVSLQILKPNTIYKLLPKYIKRKITNLIIKKIRETVEYEYINKPHLLL